MLTSLLAVAAGAAIAVTAQAPANAAVVERVLQLPSTPVENDSRVVWNSVSHQLCMKTNLPGGVTSATITKPTGDVVYKFQYDGPQTCYEINFRANEPATVAISISKTFPGPRIESQRKVFPIYAD